METVPTVTKLMDDFRREVKFLKSCFEVIPLDDLVKKLNQGKGFLRPTVAITVDDGYRDNFDLLFPLAREEKIPVTVFLTAGFIGTNKRIWVSHLAELFLYTAREDLVTSGALEERRYSLRSLPEKRVAYLDVLRKLKDMDLPERNFCLNTLEDQLGAYLAEQPLMLTWDQVREMKKYGVSFGAHSCTHPILTSIPLEEAKKEILESKIIIERELGEPVKHFAFPNGRPQDFNASLRRHCQEIGFQSVSTCDYGHNLNPDDVWSLKRIGSEIPISLFAVNTVRAFQYTNN